MQETSRKPLVGQHLMRVRIRRHIFSLLQNAADEEAENTGENVTVSDLVRAACYNYLLIRESLKRLEHSTPLSMFDNDDASDTEDETEKDPGAWLISLPNLSDTEKKAK